jgi:hypothetical protein
MGLVISSSIISSSTRISTDRNLLGLTWYVRIFTVCVMCVPSSVFRVLFVYKCVLLPPGVSPIAFK